MLKISDIQTLELVSVKYDTHPTTLVQITNCGGKADK
jgi:hypothetical protein